MKDTAAELREIVAAFFIKISGLPEETFSAKPSPARWSKKEVVGHLVDSAHNNLRRFICGQYESIPPHIIYDQDVWVHANQYQELPSGQVVLLWKILNEQICTVIEHVPDFALEKQVNTGRSEEDLHSIEWLAKDYVKHLKHHLNQVIPNSFNITYP